MINPRADLLNAVVVASRNTQQKTVASHGNAMCALSEATRKPHVPSAFAANVVNGVTLVLIVLKYGVVVVIRLGIRTKPAKVVSPDVPDAVARIVNMPADRESRPLIAHYHPVLPLKSKTMTSLRSLNLPLPLGIRLSNLTLKTGTGLSNPNRNGNSEERWNGRMVGWKDGGRTAE